MSKIEINQISNIEPLKSPFSRIYLCPQTDQTINCAIGLKHPIDAEAFKNAFSNSIIKHPRFCSLIVRNPNGQDQWKRTQVNIDDHFIVHYPTPGSLEVDEVEDEEALVNAYLAEFAVSSPLSQNKPLWEVHVLVGLKCTVLRVHHTLGDGFSLMSILSSCFGHKREVIDGLNCDVNGKKNNHANSKLWKCRIWVLIMSLWLTIVYGLRLLWRFLWVKDEISVLSGGDGVELWPRTLVTAKFNVEDLKSIKMAIPKVVSIPNVF